MDTLQRLRAVQNDCAQYAAGSDIMRDAADEIECLRAENEALRKVLGEIIMIAEWHRPVEFKVAEISRTASAAIEAAGGE